MKPVPYMESEKWEDNRRKYRRQLVKIFNSVDFPSQQERDLLLESYLANLSDLILYAYANGISAHWFIKQIETYAREYADAARLRINAQKTR